MDYWNRRNGLETDLSVYDSLVYIRDAVKRWTVSAACMYAATYVYTFLFFRKDLRILEKLHSGDKNKTND